MLTNTINVDRYQINGTPVATYAIHYPFWDKSEIKVYLTKSDGSLETLVEGTNYTLSTPNGNDGTLTRVGDWTAGATNLTIIREMSLTQEVDYRNGDKIDAETLETSLDNLTAQVQQLSESQSRAVTSPVDEAGAGLSIPNKAARIGSGSGTIMGFGADGESIALRDLAGFDADVASVATDAASASASAGSASTSAGTASTQALKSEGFAVGEQNGSPVASGSPYYRNNSKYYADVAESGAQVILDNKMAIISLYTYMPSVRSVANNIANVVAVDENKTNINAVNANKTNIDAVAGVASDVTTVAGVATDIPAVAGVATEIATLAPDLADVTAVADDLTKVKAVAEDLANIDAVNANKTNIDAVNANKTNIDTVAGIASDVSAVGAVASDVTAVAGSLTEISDIATDLNDADSAIKAVGADMAGVSAVAADLTNIDAVADDLTNIDNAVNYALEAEGYANGTQNGVPVSSGSPYYENNAKYWADAVPNLNNAINQLDHRLDNLEQAKGSYVVQNYKDGSITPSGKGNWAIVEGLRGVSRVENRILPLTCRSVTSSGVTITYDSDTHKFTLSNTATADALVWIISLDDVAVVGHRYLVGNTSNKVKIYAYFGNTNYEGQYVLSAPAVASGNYIGISLENGKTYNETIDISISDMNVYFGGTIPSDADTIAEIQTNYPHLLIPSDYGVRIVDSSYSGVRAWARNLLDKTQIKDTTYGTPTISGERISVTGTYYCSFNINLEAGQYYLKFTVVSYTGSRGVRLQYEDGTLVDTLTSSGLVTLTKKATTVLLYCGSGSSATSVYEDICINKSDSLDGTFTPYHAPDTLSLTFQGKSAGSVAEELDVVSGEVTHPLRRMTFDDDTYWQRSNDGVYFTDSVSGLYDENNLPLCPPYVAVSKASGNSDAYSKGNMTCCFRGTVPDRFYIRDDYAFVTMNYTATQFKEYIKGKTLTFALATPDPSTFVTPIIDNTLLTESGGRMATVQTGTVVDGSFDMGFITL